MMSGNMGNTGKTGKIRKPTRGKPFGHPSHGQESDSERETGGSHQRTTHQPSRPQHKPSTPARQDDRPDQAPVQRPKIKVRRPGDPSAGGIHIGGKGDDEDGHGAQAGRGDHPTGRDHPSGGLDDSPGAEFGPSSGSDTKPKAKPKPKPKPTGKGTGDRNDDEESAVSGNEAGHDPQAGRKPGGQHGTDEQSDEGEQPKDQPKPKPKPKPKPSGGGNRSEEEGDGTGDGRPLGGQPSGLTGQERLRKGQKHPKGGNVDEDEDVEKTDLGNEPEKIPVKKADASASSKVPDAFDDEGDDELTRIQRRINAIRKGGRANGVAVAEDDPDLEVADMELFEKFAVTAAERQKRMKKMLMLNDPETQIDIANALTEAVKSKWPDYVAMGFKVAFFIGDVALIATGTTDEFYLVDIPAKAIIEGAVNLYTRLTETPEEKEAAIRNGRGESAEKLEQRRLRGEVALMKLTGVEKLSKQQRETYDRLRGLLAMQRKAENAEGP